MYCLNHKNRLELSVSFYSIESIVIINYIPCEINIQQVYPQKEDLIE